MANMRVLTRDEILTFASQKQTLYFFTQDKKRLRNAKFDAIGICDYSQAEQFLLSYFKNNKAQAKNCSAVVTSIKDIHALSRFVQKYELKHFFLADVGIFRAEDIFDASCEMKMLDALAFRLDNETFSWVRFPDGTDYRKNDCLYLFLNPIEAQQKAIELTGHVGSFTILNFVMENVLNLSHNYIVNDMVIKGHVLKSACLKHFYKTALPFERVKDYIDEGLSVFAGTDDDNSFELLMTHGLSTFFTNRATVDMIHPLIRQQFPQNSTFYNIPKRENLYQFAQTPYISIDCINHCKLEIFENAIMGRNDYKQWPMREIEHTVNELFETPYLYIILSREKFDKEHKSSVPTIIKSHRPRVWLFNDYGKALNFCQRKDWFIDAGSPAIGLLTSMVEGLDLHSILSLLLLQGVVDVELNPLEDDRMLIPIDLALKTRQLTPLQKDQIHHIKMDRDEDTEDDDWDFNEIVLA